MEVAVTDNVVVEMLGAMQADLAALGADQAALRAEMQTDMHALRGDVEGLKGKIDAWPDLHFLQAAAQKQVAEAREAAEFRRYVEIKLDEIYGSMATSSEIKKLRQEAATGPCSNNARR